MVRRTEYINAVRTSDTVESIGIYSMKNRYVISSAQSGYVDEIHPEWYERYLTCKKSEFVYSSGDTVNVCHGINPGGELSGLMIFSLNKQELEHKIRLDDYRLDIGLILTNIDGNTVFECGNTGNGTKKDRIYDFSNESVSMTFAEGSGNARTVYETATIYFLLYLAVSVAVVFIMAFVCSSRESNPLIRFPTKYSLPMCRGWSFRHALAVYQKRRENILKSMPVRT